MKQPKRLLVVTALLITGLLHAQIEVGQLKTKGFSAIGFGGYLNFSVPVSESSTITLGGGFYSFRKGEEHVALAPFLAGYRKQLNGSATGVYVEPVAGYSLGATDISKRDENGREEEQVAKGLTAGIGTGYIFAGNIPINIGLQYRRVFVSNDPALTLASLRLSYPLSFGRRED